MKEKNEQTYIILAFIAIIAFLWFKKQKEETKTNGKVTPTPGSGGGGGNDNPGTSGGDNDGDDDNGDDGGDGDDDNGDDPENPNIIVGGLIYQPHNDPLTLNPSDLQQYEELNMELLPTRNNEEPKLPMEILPDERFEDLVKQNLRRFNQSLKISRRETIHFVSNI